MNSKCFLLLAFAFLGASAAPLVSTATVGLHGAGVVGPTVSETLVTPFHRTDAVASPCGHSVVHTSAVPVASYGLGGGSGFLGTGAGVYPGAVSGGFLGTGAFHGGVAAGGLLGSTAGYNGIGYHGFHGVGGVTGAGILSGGLGGFGGAGHVI